MKELFELHKQIIGYQITQAIYTAVKLGVPELVSSHPVKIDEIATQLNLKPGILYRLMRALASEGIFVENKPRHFSHTKKSEFLSVFNPHNQVTRILRSGKDNYLAWSKLSEGISDNKCPFELFYEVDFFSYLDANPKSADTFNKSMSSLTNYLLPSILESFDFSKYKTIVDLGGGFGQLIMGITRKHPDVQGIIFDLPAVVAKAEANLGNHNTTNCKWISGDFFDEIPIKADLYILRNILHDWTDENALTILNACRKTMPEKSKILVIEDIISAQKSTSTLNLWKDLEMFVYLNGKERTKSEFENLFEKARLSIRKIIPTSSFPFIIEIEKSTEI